ncbi:phage tail tape measure protein [Vibrio parahaemolyticus]|uniref:phage tail tape measure protein n=1 Tax=Vibrio parahaemolyticus TaxID=670 RepID=UPI00301CF70D|nr:phage tail tape measure protein [Vibrio parahaemolyticus]
MAGRNVTIGNVNIAMSANAAQLIKQTEQAQKKFTFSMKTMTQSAKKFQKQIKSVSGTASSLSSPLRKLALAGTAGSAVFVALASSAYESQRELQRMADVAGLSLSEFTQMSHVTNSLGLQTEYLADAMKDLNVRIVDAARGGGTMVDFFALLGESAADWEKLSPTEQLDKFQNVLSELKPNEAKFWADEINDSMYRLSVTLNRSGKTLSEFQKEAESLGAGTSAGYMYMVNGMYESFSRLRIILGELSNTTLALLAQTFGETFDAMTEKLKGFLKDGKSTSEAIFNMSRDIAIYILKTFKEIYESTAKFLHSLRLLLGKFEPSFLEGMDTDAQKRLDKIGSRLESIRYSLEQVDKRGEGALMGLTTSVALREEETRLLEEQVKLKEKLNAPDAVGGVLDGLIKNLKDATYVPPQKGAGGSSGSSSKGSTSPIDPADLKVAQELLRSMQKDSSKLEDSQLKQIALERERIELLVKHYKALEQEKGITTVTTQYLEQAQSALEALEQKRKKREAELREEREKERLEEANQEIELEKRKNQLRIEALQKYASSAREIRQLQYANEDLELKALLVNKALSLEEFNALTQKMTEDRVNAELRAEMTKWGATLEGLSFFMNESQTMVRAGFALTQAAALQEVLMNQYRAISAAWADPSLPWYMKAGAAVTAAGAVGAQLSKIQAMGQFHNGGQIPYDGTYYMEGGEIVIPKDRVGDYIDAVDKHGDMQGGGGGTVINSTINMGANLVDEKVMAAALAKQQSTIAALVQKEQRKRPTRHRSR